MLKQIQKIAIVGGGTAAWLTAAYLRKNTPFNIIVIDKEFGSPVGVGEGTLLGFDSFLQDCGFDKSEWMIKCDATYKSGILFPNFGKDDSLIWHPFILNPNYNEFNSNLYEALTYIDKKHFNELLPFFNINLKNKVDLENLESYGYHVDCGKLVQFIQNKIIHNLEFVQSTVIEINRDSDNNIISIECENGERISADLFIDCTGFNKVLSNKQNEVDLTTRLFVDTAVAAHVDYIDPIKEKTPFVVSEAVDHGWIWTIPTNTRIGSGLVFNRSITDTETAKKYFCDYWNNRISVNDCKIIDWTPFYEITPWQNNKISIGLSAGFIEPLESTGLATIINSITKLCAVIAAGYYTKNDIKLYNKYFEIMFEEATDFVNMHYSHCSQTSEFWRHVNETKSLSETYHFYKKMIESGEKINNEGKGYIFGGANWLCWMYQILDMYPKNTNINETTADKILQDWKEQLRIAEYKKNIIQHHKLLQKI